MGIWRFPFGSEGTARYCAGTLTGKGYDDIGLSQVDGVWHVTASMDSAHLPVSRSFLTSRGIAGAAFMEWVL